MLIEFSGCEPTQCKNNAAKMVCAAQTLIVVSFQPNITGPELDKLRAVLLRHCDANKDGKIQRNELALCLGVKP